jgi:hypothetical protein
MSVTVANEQGHGGEYAHGALGVRKTAVPQATFAQRDRGQSPRVLV